MHENRETSNAPAGNSGRTVGEGSGRNARVHASEESDSGILPMNHSNKIEQSMAESEEGRPLIKENTHQSNTRPTQSGARVSQGLAGVRKAAREHKGMKFTALLHHVTIDLLRDSFGSLKRRAAPRVDGMTWQEYETGLEDRLRSVVQGYFNYYAVPGNLDSLGLFRERVLRYWGKRFSAVVKYAGTSGFVVSSWPHNGFLHLVWSIPGPLISSPPLIRDESRMR